MTGLPPDPPDEPPQSTIRAATALGLSKKDLDKVIKSMAAVVRRVGCPSHIAPLEVVHDAFVTALSKPVAERPDVSNKEHVTAWLCSLAKSAALTNRNSKHRRILADDASENQLDMAAAGLPRTESVLDREAVRKALAALDDEDRALIIAHHFEGKTIDEIARELDRPWTTIHSRRLRALQIMRAALGVIVAAFAFLNPRRANARNFHWKFHAQRLLVPFAHATGTLGITVVCGAVVSSSSSAAPMHDDAQQFAMTTMVTHEVSMERYGAPNQFDATKLGGTGPEKPSDVDVAVPQWSAAEMKPKLITSLLQSTWIPFAFLVAPALVELGCSGAQPRTVETEEPEPERSYGFTDPYERMCANERRRGSDCVSREEWYRKLGLCPDGTHDCQK